ncbi:tryptophan synthase, alpha chain [Hathewaya proteolytica DSM 3090]|uniref:Tryptophan synthase alpha chain n=1 Tax=Hathewaya proteolytica DSM 3090 TaxID=1121331 RepID=A0A1M6K709_9CLOT|nr:tryptophan synthase subunit alpha [Hathewaya proteolytica]SHJ54725.1 tryptophan synthase, alpha chain [Hathewaya proteolytica DSM 3090]
MNNSLDTAFKELKEKGEKALACFLTAGDPTEQCTLQLVKVMEQAGADIIEIGIPYADPLADGPTIQNSSKRALKHGINIPKIMNLVKTIRNSEVKAPIVYLMYYNSIFKYGMERFLKQCSEVGVQGLIIPDVPVEERGELGEMCLKNNVYLIPLVAPTSEERIEKITKDGHGFVYCVSVNGVTGTRDSINTDMEEYMSTVGKYTSIPRMIGFGISSVETARKMKEHSEGVIIGSAIVNRIANIKEDMSNYKEVENHIKIFIEEIKNELKR